MYAAIFRGIELVFWTFVNYLMQDCCTLIDTCSFHLWPLHMPVPEIVFFYSCEILLIEGTLSLLKTEHCIQGLTLEKKNLGASWLLSF